MYYTMYNTYVTPCNERLARINHALHSRWSPRAADSTTFNNCPRSRAHNVFMFSTDRHISTPALGTNKCSAGWLIVAK